MDAKTLQVGENVFSSGMIPAEESVFVQVAIARVIGEPLFKALIEGGAKEGDEGAAEKTGAFAIGQILAKMDAKELLDTMKTVFKYVSCDGKRVEMNSTFTGRPKLMWQVFIFALRVNFADFFPEKLLTSLAGKVT